MSVRVGVGRVGVELGEMLGFPFTNFTQGSEITNQLLKFTNKLIIFFSNLLVYHQLPFGLTTAADDIVQLESK